MTVVTKECTPDYLNNTILFSLVLPMFEVFLLILFSYIIALCETSMEE